MSLGLLSLGVSGRLFGNMGRLLVGYVVFSLCLWYTSQAWMYSKSRDVDGSDDSSNQRLMSLLRDVKRSRSVEPRNNWIQALCGKWDDWCVPDQTKPGLTCCSGYTCKCNLWNTNCRCKSKLFSG